MLFEFVVLTIVLLGVRLRGGSLQVVFGPHWRSLRQLTTDLGVGVLLLLGSTLIGSILGWPQREGADGPSIAYLLPQTWNEILLWMALSLAAGVCEEAVYRGYLQCQLSALSAVFPLAFVFPRRPLGQRMLIRGFGALLSSPSLLSCSAGLLRRGAQFARACRVPFQTLLDYLEGGDTLDEFLEQYPRVTRENAIAALEEAKELLFARLRK